MLVPYLRRIHRTIAFLVFIIVTLYVYECYPGYEPRSSVQNFQKRVVNPTDDNAKAVRRKERPRALRLVDQSSNVETIRPKISHEEEHFIYDNSLQEFEGRDGVPARDRDIPDPKGFRNMPMEDGFYRKNGIKRMMLSGGPSATRLYLPYPLYDSQEYQYKWKGTFQSCEGANGELLNRSDESMSYQYAYRGTPEGFPKPIAGSFEAIGLDDNVCFDRVTRYGIYGLDQDEFNLHEKEKILSQSIDWGNVNWGYLQTKCLRKNQERFPHHARVPSVMTPSPVLPRPPIKPKHDEIRRKSSPSEDDFSLAYRSRTAILIRVWEGYNYTPNDLLAIRAMITELSLRSGGEYQVFLFVNVKDLNAKIFNSWKENERVLRRVVPKEFRSITILWNEAIFPTWYPKIGDYQVYRHQFMSVQWFMLTHPEFDYVWNWEADMRYTGNHYHLLSRIEDFAAKQPRRYLWERNARLYLPSVHGSSYTAFVNDTNDIIKAAFENGSIPELIWGPKPYSPIQKPLGPRPPDPNDPNADAWGVDEDADLITLLPIWDPRHVDWNHKRKMWNYVDGKTPTFDDRHGPTDRNFDHVDFDKIDRRVVVNTALRLSKRLLRAMHEENLAGRDMLAEQFPASVALHHGFKAVYAPHPIWSQHRFPSEMMDKVFNADGGIPARWGQEWDSIYSENIEKNFKAWSWSWGELGKVLYRRWMGWSATDGMGAIGGTKWEQIGDWEPGKGGGMGRMCLPGMLLHPVKTEDLGDNESDRRLN